MSYFIFLNFKAWHASAIAIAGIGYRLTSTTVFIRIFNQPSAVVIPFGAEVDSANKSLKILPRNKFILKPGNSLKDYFVDLKLDE